MPKEAVYCIVLFVGAIVLYLFFVMKTLKKKRKNVRVAFLDLDVSMKKNWDLIPNVILKMKKTLKGEDLRLLEEIIILRNTTYQNMNVRKKIEVTEKLEKLIGTLFKSLEENDVLKNDREFLNLRIEMESVWKTIEDQNKSYGKAKEIYKEYSHKRFANLVAKTLKYDALE